MGRKKILTDEEIDKASQLYKDGKNTYEIAKIFDVSHQTISKYIKNNGIKIRSQRVLTNEQINKASQLYKDGKSIYDIADIFDISCETIRKWIKNNGVKIRNTSKANKKLTNKQVKQASQFYKDGKTLKEVAKVFDVDHSTIYKNIKNNGTKIRGNYLLNENIFNDINEKSAYWVGFLLADGNIYKPPNNGQNEISIHLAKKDTNHLYKFRDFLETEKPVYKNNKSSRISISSNKVSKELEKYGVVPRKSKIAKVSKELINNKHFWRGMIDGDGGISLHRNQVVVYLSGTKKVCNQFRNYVRTFSYTKANIGRSSSIYRFAIEGNNIVPPILKHFYEDANIYLDRKYDLAKEYF